MRFDTVELSHGIESPAGNRASCCCTDQNTQRHGDGKRSTENALLSLCGTTSTSKTSPLVIDCSFILFLYISERLLGKPYPHVWFGVSSVNAADSGLPYTSMAFRMMVLTGLILSTTIKIKIKRIKRISK